MDNGSIITRFSDLEPGSYDIRGRTGFKSTTQSFEGYNGETKYFFFILFEDKTTQQQSSTPIRVCAYARDYVRFFFTIRPHKLYILRNVTITENINKKATSKLHVKLTRDSVVEEILEREKLSFVRLNLVEPQYESDLIGVINEISDTVFTNTRDGRLTCRRNLIIVDESLHWLSVTVWGDQAKEFKGTRGDVFVTAKAFITPYNGKSAQAKGTVFLNPEIVETKRLKDWFKTLGEDPKFIPPGGNSRSDQTRISASEQMVKMECDSG